MKKLLPIILAVIGIIAGIFIYILARLWAAPSIQDEAVVSANIGASFLGVAGVALAAVSALALIALIVMSRQD